MAMRHDRLWRTPRGRLDQRVMRSSLIVLSVAHELSFSSNQSASGASRRPR